MAFVFNPLSGSFDQVNFGANKTLSNLTSPTAINQHLTFTSTFTTQVLNDVALQGRNQFNTAWVDMIKVGSAGQIVIGNATNNFSSGSLIPTAHNTYTLGSSAFYWSQQYSVIYNGGGSTWQLSTTPSGAGSVAALSGNAAFPVALITASRTDATASSPILIESGNNTVGDSGDIRLRIGTSGATRGKIEFVDGTEGVSGYLWRSVGTSGEGGWASQATAVDHGSIGGLSDDDHTQYALLAGRVGGQTLSGSQTTAENLTLRPNSANTTTGAVIINGPNLNPTANNTTSLGTSSLRYATLFSNRIANYTSTTVTPTVTGPVLLSGRYNNTGGGTTTVSATSTGSNAANFLLGSVLNTSSGTATFSVAGGGNFAGGVVNGAGTINVVGASNFIWGRSSGANTSIFTDIAAEGNFVYGEAFPGVVGASSISASGSAAAGCFVGGWIQGSDSSATPSSINVSYFGCFAQGMIVDGGNIGAGGVGLGPFAQGYATLLGAIYSLGDGSFAQGYAEEGSIIANARGTVAHGAVVGAYAITASSSGAIALGYANGASITASADGAGAFGNAYGGVNIVASASNAFQFARGTNSTADSLQIGVSGTGVKIYGSGQIDIPGVLNHDGATLGFYAVTPVARPAAYTQTYSTATRTHSNLTSATLTDSTTGTANTTVVDVTAVYSQTILNDNFADLIAQINALRVDLVNAKGVLNQVIDDLQANGLLQ